MPTFIHNIFCAFNGVLIYLSGRLLACLRRLDIWYFLFLLGLKILIPKAAVWRWLSSRQNRANKTQVTSRFDRTFSYSGANLKGVDMEGSQMTGINLRVATLKNAKLKNCNLRGATLAGTDLEVSVSVRGDYLFQNVLRGRDGADHSGVL